MPDDPNVVGRLQPAGEPPAERAGEAAAASPAPPVPMADPASSQWPDSLAFWLLITALVIAVPSALCAFGFHLLRRAW